MRVFMVFKDIVITFLVFTRQSNQFRLNFIEVPKLKHISLYFFGDYDHSQNMY